ncbi:MAG: ATP-dependent sacrificial sulfur transferase LarE [Clostridiales bacterium]
MEEILYKKLNQLKEFIKSKKKVLIAFSGGIDSTFLLKVAKDVLGRNLLAVYINFSVVSEDDFNFVLDYTKSLNVELKVINIDELKIHKFAENPVDRCYYCKKTLFEKIIEFAKLNNYKYIFDGSNFDDLKDYRPGEKALKELNILSPLKDFKFTKEEIRFLSKSMEISIWNKPSEPCFASRFPYGVTITKKGLNMVKEGEKILKDLGFTQVRVRYHGDIARIEILNKEFDLMFKKEIMKTINSKFMQVGFKYITLDLKGYRMGSLNEKNKG